MPRIVSKRSMKDKFAMHTLVSQLDHPTTRKAALSTILGLLQAKKNVKPLMSAQLALKIVTLHKTLILEEDKQKSPELSSSTGLQHTAILFIVLHLTTSHVMASRIMNEKLLDIVLYHIHRKVDLWEKYDARIVPCVAALHAERCHGLNTSEDLCLMVDAASVCNGTICNDLEERGETQYLVPVGVESLCKLLLDVTLPYNTRVENIQMGSGIEQIAMKKEDRDIKIFLPDLEIPSSSIFNCGTLSQAEQRVENRINMHFQDAMFFSTLFTNSLRNAPEKKEEPIEVFIVLEKTPRAPTPPLSKEQRILEWKAKQRTVREDNIAWMAAHIEFHRHLASRILLSLSYALPHTSSEWNAYVTTGGLSAMVAVANYRAPCNLFVKCSSTEEDNFLVLENVIKTSMIFAMQHTSKIAQIGISRLHSNELVQVTRWIHNGSLLDGLKIDPPVVKVLSELLQNKTALVQKNKMQQKIKKEMTRSSNLKVRLQAVKLSTSSNRLVKNPNQDELCAAICRRQAISDMVLKRNTVQKMLDESQKILERSQKHDGIVFEDWVTTIPTIEARRKEDGIIAAAHRHELQRVHDKEVRKRLEEEAEEREILEMQEYDKHPETEAERRDRLAQKRDAKSANERKEKRWRLQAEKRRWMTMREVKNERREISRMTKEDLLCIQRISGKKSDAEAAAFIEQAERIRHMRLRDEEKNRIEREGSCMICEDTLARNLRAVLRKKQQELEKVEASVMARERPLMQKEEHACRSYYAHEKAEAATAVKIQKRQERRKVRQKLNLKTKAEEEEAKWEESYDEETGSLYYYHRSTGAMEATIPINDARKELNEMEEHERKPENELVQTVWERHHDEDGNEYFENVVTGETAWEDPGQVKETQSEEWIERRDADENLFFENVVTGETAWEKPLSSQNTARLEKEECAEDWILCECEDGSYYFNTVSQESRWDMPTILLNMVVP